MRSLASGELRAKTTSSPQVSRASRSRSDILSSSAPLTTCIPSVPIPTISAHRQEEAEGKHRSEFHYGAFARSVTLPEGTDEDHILASYDSGILEVVVTLKDQAAGKAPKRIPVFMNKHTKPT